MNECQHKSTGSQTLMNKNWRVLCMDCRVVLAETPAAKEWRATCPGWERESRFGHFCKHCWMDAEAHIEVLTARLKLWEQASAGNRYMVGGPHDTAVASTSTSAGESK